MRATLLTIFEGSDHDADRGCRRAIVSIRQFPRDGWADISDAHKGEGEDLRIHIRHCIHTAVHGPRTAQLATLHLSTGSGQTVFLAAPTPERGRPAHVLVWLDRKRRHRRVRAGLDRYDYFRSVAPPGDRFLLRPGRALANRPCWAEDLHHRLGNLRCRLPGLRLGGGTSGVRGRSSHHLLCAVPIGGTRVDELVVDRAYRRTRRPRQLA